MQPEKRKALKCNKCSSSEKDLKTTPRLHNDDKNVTQRRKTAVISKHTAPTTSKTESPVDKSSPVQDTCHVDYEVEFQELDELEESEDTQLDMFSKSEDFSNIKICEMQEMKAEIKELNTNLLSTQNELENTIIENNQYKREIQKLKKEIDVLKGICQSPILNNALEVKNNVHNALTPSKTLKYSRISYSAPITPKSSEKKTNEMIIFLQNKIKASQELLTNAKNDITKLETQIEELQMRLKQQDNPQPTFQETEKQEKPCSKQNIIIVGTQQCTGLAAELIKSRINSSYEKYQVSAFIKPFATTEEALKICKHLEVNVHDKVILCVGENDEDPVTTMAELFIVLKLLQHTTVIVMNVINSKNLNNTLLNSRLKLICNKFKHSHFLESKKYYHNHLKNISYNINLLIDSMYYNKTFLYFPFIKKQIQRGNDCGGKLLDKPQSILTNRKHTLRQTSILDFFYYTPKGVFFRFK